MILVMRTLVLSAIVLPLASTSVGGVVIDASYPGGNGRLVSVDAEQRVVKVATDPKGGKDYYWFNFEVSGLTLGVWRFKGLRLTAAGPAVSEDHGKTWRFLSPKGDAAWDEFVYEVKQGPGPVRFALSIPYQLSDWKLLMSSLPASPRLHAGTLCSDRSGRNVPLLEVFPEEKRAKMTLLFTARHHCCEASASHVLEGIVREVFSGSEEGRWVADNARVVVVPFMDLDGVENGEQGKHRLPHDHNRDYVKEVYPTVRALKNLVSEKYADVPVYFVDLHAPDLRGREHDHFYTLGPRGKVQVGRWDAFRCELEAATRTAALRHDPKWDIPYGAPWNDDKAHFVEQQGLLSSRRYFERLSNAYVSFCMEFGYGLCGGVFSHEAAVELGGNVLKAQVSSIRRSVEFDPIRSAVVETQAVRSAAMGRDIPVSIVLPKGYDSDKDKRWPVVFCLHGAGGDHTSHAQERERRYADKYGFIIVSPDGEKTSWWLDSPVDPRMRYETFLTEELIPYVDARYRTFACRERRAIMGGSMGGYGACRMGFRHKDVFGAVGNIYGGVDFWEFPDKWDITLRLGKRDANPSRWREFSVLADATRLRNGDLALITIVGTDDFFLSCNRKLHDLLARNGVEHTYVEYRGKDLAHSSHTMDFFEYAMPIELEFFRRHFEAAVAPESIAAVTCPKCPARMRLSPDGTSATINLARVGVGEMGAQRKRARSFMDLAAKTRMGGRLRPMMGWSSWNTFGLKVNDRLILETARAMKDKGLAQAGYRYVNIDDGFFDGRDESGRLRVRQDSFPGGMKPVVEGIHALGLKAGTYSDAGTDTCGSIFGGDVHGKGAGLYGHDADDFRLHFLDEGFDFIKIDYCGGRKQGLDVRERYFEIAKGLLATGRDDVRFNICRWAFPGVWAGEIADSWRTTRDIRASWKSLSGIVRENIYLGAYIRPGHYNDLDMLEVGQIMGKVKTDFGKEDTGLTRDEEILHFGFWCFMSSPLLLGCDVRTMDETSLRLVTNPFLLAMNQNDLAAVPSVVSRCNETYVLVKDADTADGLSRYVALLNLSEEEREQLVRFDALEFAGRVMAFDLVERADLGVAEDSYSVKLAPHAARFYRLDAERRLPRIRYEAEDAILRAYHELDRKSGGDTSTKAIPGVPVYEQDPSASGSLVVSNLGGSPENDIVWPRVRVFEGGPNRIDVITYGDGDYMVEVDGEPAQKGQTLTSGIHSIRLFNAEKPMPKVDCLVVK